MDERTIRALIEAGAVRQVRVIADGARFRIDVETGGGTRTASTYKGAMKTWRTLAAAARWARGLGVDRFAVDLEGWRPGQRELAL